MLQKSSNVLIMDNSGARNAMCIHVYNGYRRRYAFIMDQILLTIKRIKKVKLKGTKIKKTLKPKSKIKKGMVIRAVVIETKNGFKKFNGDISNFRRNVVVLLSDKKKFLGSRLFTPISTVFRKTKYARLIFMAKGFIA